MSIKSKKSITKRIFGKLLTGFLIISIVNILITNFILGLGITFKIGFLDLSQIFTSILLTIISLIEFMFLYIIGIGFGR